MPFDDDDIRPVERRDPGRDVPGDLNSGEGVGTDGSLESVHGGDGTRTDQGDGDGVGTDGSLESGHQESGYHESSHESGHRGDVFDERRDR
jgi:hypothetical protein